MAQRSEYLGVYNVAADKVEDGKVFRVAIKLKDRKTSKFSWFNVRDQFASEKSAARVYNAYAISFFGKGAILNKVEGTPEELQEVKTYFAAKPNRQETLEKVKAKMAKLTDEGHVFRTHLELDNSSRTATA